MRLQLERVELDAHRHALHHLDPVAGGVLGRQQREGRAGAGAQAGDTAAVGDLVAIDVGRQRGRLADAQGAQLRLSVPALGGEVMARDVPSLKEGQEATLAIRPEKLVISKERPEGGNAFQGTVKDLAYFGKDSLYRVVLPSGALVQAHAVNAKRGGEAARAADWDDQVWISFAPSSAIVLAE